ncbi:MAG: chitobiase/beta-hexosaminidase C-terminal domain-containing protein [Planctomycetes bacterium]|jgi:hypothetical protein|nr:chitobiase/beta-hexosaminidase C-terminal domain-containing protein [Planctomycetota bacterium]
MRSKQMLVRCGILAVVLMSTGVVAAAPSPAQVWPSLAGGLVSLEVTHGYYECEMPQLTAYGVDWYGRLWLWFSCPTFGSTIRYTGDGSDPQWYSPVCNGVLIVTGTGTLKLRAFANGMWPSHVLTITIE